MTAKNGLPCKKCGTSGWDRDGHCKTCHRAHVDKWNTANKGQKKEAERLWRAANPEKVAWYTREWRQANPDKVNATTHRRRTRKTKAGGSYTPGEWKALCAQYDNHCCYPGCERTDLHADHVIPVSKGGSSNIDNMQPLCEYHNKSKANKIIDYRGKPGIVRWLQRKLFG